MKIVLKNLKTKLFEDKKLIWLFNIHKYFLNSMFIQFLTSVDKLWQSLLVIEYQDF